MFGYWEFLPYLSAMGGLLAASAFFSGSEAALFYLGREDRELLQSGGAAARRASQLLATPDRLLTTILFWNLVVNMLYFAIASVLSLRLQREGLAQEAGALALGALLVVILFGEMLPKNVAVLWPRKFSMLVSIPLAAAARLLDPISPLLQTITLLSRRLIAPQIEPEPYLKLGDLERAITLSTSDQALADLEHAALQRIVTLSEMTTDELMRPRLRYRSFKPPLHRTDVATPDIETGYLLVAEPDSEEIAAAIPLKRMAKIPEHHLERYAQDVVYLPWCATVAAALDTLRTQGKEVAAVVNELGETIGILTQDDILQAVFDPHFTRSERLLQAASLEQIGPGEWKVSGMTTLRRISKKFGVELPETWSVTVAGVLQEQLERMPEAGDVVRWGGFEFQVTDAPQRGTLLARIRPIKDETASSQGREE